MGVGDALRPPGGPGREEDVRDRLGRDVDDPPPPAARRWRGVVNGQNLPPRRHRQRPGVPVDEHEAGADLIEELGEASGRVGWIQGDEGLPGPQDPEGRRDAGEPLAQDEGDRLPSRAQAPHDLRGDARGQVVELAVGQAVGAVRDGEAAGVRGGHRREAALQRVLHAVRGERSEPGRPAEVLTGDGSILRPGPGQFHAVAHWAPACPLANHGGTRRRSSHVPGQPPGRRGRRSPKRV